ncbi:uncharacterized protein LOC123987679 [Osmia bicornis bicornis]|uniref:uncharacterized protein LOC123987679 n=1 Tax=Osmia bicornis bicornis TaxID=1437191 RepID=UPI001EAF62F1|nr:uncharacterized protein LOC123987679 [Osmia bicornis bicornis]
MPKSRDPSPVSKPEETPAAMTASELDADHATETTTQPSQAARPRSPTTLQVPEETSQTTRTRSPTRLTAELQVRSRVQEERLDTLLAMVEDLQVTLNKAPADVAPEEPELMRDTILEIHVEFQREHAALSKVWPSTQLDHAYFKEKVASNEARVVLSARKLLAQLERKIKQTTQPTQTTTASTSDAPTQSSASRSRLPEIALPKFEGDYSKWAEFKAHFASVISERADLAAHDKFLYLKGAVTGHAANLISHLPTTDGALEQAWELLDGRYDNKRLNVQSHMDRLANLKPMKMRKAASLLKMVNIIQETQQALRSFGLEDAHNCFLLTILVRLLDADTREHWESSLATTKDYPTLEQLTTFLLARARTLEQLEQLSTARAVQPTPTTTSRTTQPSQQRSAPARVAAHAGTTRTVAPAPAAPAANARSTQSALYPCAFCQKDHFLSACPPFRALTPHDRANVVKAHALCVNCLGHHNLRSCRTRQRCKICEEIHHTMLHGADISKVLVPGLPPTAPSQTTSTPAPAATTQTTPTTSTTTH